MQTHIRNYQPRDLALIAAVINAADSFDRMEEGTTVEELQERFARPGFKPAEDFFVAADEKNRIVGAAGMYLVREPHEAGFRSWLEVHPRNRGRGLEDRLLARLHTRALERLPAVDMERVYFAGGGHTAHAERLAALERSGMKEVRRFWVMLRTNLHDLPAPRFPPEHELLVRNYRVGADDEAVRVAMNDAFREHWGYSEETAELWQHFVCSPKFRPDLTVVVEDSRANRIAGANLIVVNQSECERLGRKRGWVDVLGVRREYRQRGLGAALLIQGMLNLRDAGMAEAVLGCDSENTTGATRLYERVGFKVHKTTIAYGKYLRGAAVGRAPERELAVA